MGRRGEDAAPAPMREASEETSPGDPGSQTSRLQAVGNKFLLKGDFKKKLATDHIIHHIGGRAGEPGRELALHWGGQKPMAPLALHADPPPAPQ